jgi:hypothetical protein
MEEFLLHVGSSIVDEHLLVAVYPISILNLAMMVPQMKKHPLTHSG